MNKKKGSVSGGLNTTYLTKMGIKNLITNRSMSLSSISVLTACLLLIGISTILVLNIQTLVSDIESQNVIVAFVDDDADDTTVAKVGSDLSAIANVTAVEFVSKEEAYAEQLAEFGVDESLFSDNIDNPLPDSYRITVTDLEYFYVTLEQIESVANIQSVRESQELVSQISTIQTSITVICGLLVVVLTIVSLFIIVNTIRITMVSRKIDIQVMKSVGATNVFICWPFVIEGIFIGIISGVTALFLTYLVEVFEGDAIDSLLSMFGSTGVAITEYLGILFAAYLVSGVLIGGLGSMMSIRKYLRKEGSEANEI